MTPRFYRVAFWLGLFVSAILLLGQVQAILLPFVAGLVIAYILAPAVGRLESWGIRRSLGSLLVVVLFLLAVVFVLLLLVPLIQGQVVQLIAKVPSLVASLQNQIGKLMVLLQERLPAERGRPDCATRSAASSAKRSRGSPRWFRA